MSALLVTAILLFAGTLVVRALTGHMEPLWVAFEVLGIGFCCLLLIATRNER